MYTLRLNVALLKKIKTPIIFHYHGTHLREVLGVKKHLQYTFSNLNYRACLISPAMLDQIVELASLFFLFFFFFLIFGC